MPLSIPNTTVPSTNYTDALTFAGNDVFEWGFFTIANNACFCQMLEGERGQSVPQPELFLPPATYPVAGGKRPISGLRFRAAVAGATPAPQVFGSLFYPNEPGVQAGTPFTGVVSASGAVGVGVGVLDRSTSTVDVNTSNVETSVYTFSVPAASMSIDSRLVLTLYGDELFNNNAADTLRLRVKFGGTTQIDTTIGGTIGLDANRRVWKWEVEIMNLGSLTQQYIQSEFQLTRNEGITLNTGLGGLGANAHSIGNNAGFRGGRGSLNALGIIDTSLATVVDVTVQYSAASANNSFRKRYGILELQ